MPTSELSRRAKPMGPVFVQHWASTDSLTRNPRVFSLPPYSREQRGNRPGFGRVFARSGVGEMPAGVDPECDSRLGPRAVKRFGANSTEWPVLAQDLGEFGWTWREIRDWRLADQTLARLLVSRIFTRDWALRARISTGTCFARAGLDEEP